MSLQDKRIKLYGRDATKEEVAKEISRLLLGEAGTNQKPMSVPEVANTLGFTSRTTVYSYIDLAIREGYLEVDSDPNTKAKYKKPVIKDSEKFEEYSEKNPVVNHPLIKEWVQNMQTRKAGQPIDSWNDRLKRLTSFLNTLRITPRSLLISLEQTDKYAEQFLLLYKEGKAKIKYHHKTLRYINEGKLEKLKIDSVAYRYAQAYRDFMNFHKMPYPKNWGGVSSQKVVGHGKYADIYLLDTKEKKEYEIADNYLKDNYGIYSPEYRMFWFFIQSASRHGAAFGATLDHKVIVNQKTNKRAYVVEVYESKTKQKKGGKWKKYLTKPELQDSIDQAIKDGGKMMFHPYTKEEAETKLKEAYKKLWIFMGKDQIHKDDQDDDFGYFVTHPFHVFRHLGAHYLLQVTNYNYNLVARLGGWWTIKELQDSYGEMPEHIMFNALLGQGEIMTMGAVA